MRTYAYCAEVMLAATFNNQLAFAFGDSIGREALLIGLTGAAKDSVPLGVEPIVFGLLAAGWDFLLIQVKRTARKILSDAKRKAEGRG